MAAADGAGGQVSRAARRWHEASVHEAFEEEKGRIESTLSRVVVLYDHVGFICVDKLLIRGSIALLYSNKVVTGKPGSGCANEIRFHHHLLYRCLYSLLEW